MRLSKRWAIAIALVASAVIAFIVTIPFVQRPSGPPCPSNDYNCFTGPKTAGVELVRQWFMRPFSGASGTFGYDPTYEMIRGGDWGGGWHNGFVLIDSNLILAKALDYSNAQKGIVTHVEANLRQWLTNTTFNDPQTGQGATYQGNDRREIMFGKILACVMDTSGQVYYVPGHTLSDPVPITTAIPTTCANPLRSSAMSVLALWIELYYLEGNSADASKNFDVTVSGWTPTPGTGIGGSIGGYFNDQLDGGKCKSSRTLALWVHMVRATGFWNRDSQTRTMAQQVQNQLWANQGSDGGISSSYPTCTGYKATPESSGYALLAYDPRVPSWFSISRGSTSTGQMSPDSQQVMAANRFVPQNLIGDNIAQPLSRLRRLIWTPTANGIIRIVATPT